MNQVVLQLSFTDQSSSPPQIIRLEPADHQEHQLPPCNSTVAIFEIDNHNRPRFWISTSLSDVLLSGILLVPGRFYEWRIGEDELVFSDGSCLHDSFLDLLTNDRRRSVAPTQPFLISDDVASLPSTIQGDDQFTSPQMVLLPEPTDTLVFTGDVDASAELRLQVAMVDVLDVVPMLDTARPPPSASVGSRTSSRRKGGEDGVRFPVYVSSEISSAETKAIDRTRGLRVSTNFSKDVQAVVTSGKLKRTTTVMLGIVRGLPIVCVNKILEMYDGNLDQKNLWIKDEEAEEKWGFTLEAAIEKARKKKVLDKYMIMVPRKEVVTMTIGEFKQLVTEAGGKWIGKFDEKNEPYIIVIGDENDAHKYPKIWNQNVLLDAFFTQRLDLHKHRVV